MDISHYCEHFKSLKLTRTIEINQQSACRYCLIGKNYLWMCLAKNCCMFFCQRNYYEHMNLHLEQSRNKKGFHSIFINVLTARIFCIHCKIEIYDLDQIVKKKEQTLLDPFKLRLKVLPALNSLESEKNKLMGQLENPQGHKKVNRCLTGLFGNRINHTLNSAIQFLMQFSFYRDLLLNFKGKNKELDQLRKIFMNCQEAQYRAISTDELTKIIISQNPQLRGYSRKDPFQQILHLMTLLHEKIKFYSVQNQQQKCDEWDYLGRPGLTSLVTLNCPLFDNISTTLSLNYQCQECKATYSSPAHINFLKLNFPRKKRKAKEVEKQLADHRVTSPIKNRRNSLVNLFLPQQQCPFTVQQLIIEFLKQPFHKDRDCSQCKKPYSKKKMHFSQLSDHLIIQINRMGRDGNSIDQTLLQFPQEPIDMGPYTENKDENLLYELEAAICIEKGCLFPVVSKSKYNKQMYIFKNEIVTMLRTQKMPPNPYILCYKKIKKEEIINKTVYLHKKILQQESQNELDDQKYVLPDFFTIQLQHHIFPSLNNPIVCHHNHIKPVIVSKMMNPTQISKELYEQIVSMFLLLSSKGISHIRQNKNYLFTPRKCKTCQDDYKKIQNRRNLERNKVLQYQKLGQKSGGCMVSSDWIKKWVNFLYKKGEYGYMFRGYPMPGPVDNKNLLESNGKCKSNLKKGEDYKVVSIYIWRLLKDLYGGGPQIRYKWKKSNLLHCQQDKLIQIRNYARQIKQIYHIEIPDSPKKSIIIQKSSSYVESTRAKEEQISD